MGFGVRTGARLARAVTSHRAADRNLAANAWPPGDASAGGLPEIDCIRPLLDADVLAAAARRAAAVGVGADRVLIASGRLSEEAYLRALAERLGVAFEPLDGIARALPDRQRAPDRIRRRRPVAARDR